MRRREFITLVGGGAAAWPFAARAQQADKVYRIGIFASINPIMGSAYSAFFDELRVQGFIQGQNLLLITTLPISRLRRLRAMWPTWFARRLM